MEEQIKHHHQSIKSLKQEKQASVNEQVNLRREIQRLKNLADEAQKKQDDEIEALLK